MISRGEVVKRVDCEGRERHQSEDELRPQGMRFQLAKARCSRLDGWYIRIEKRKKEKNNNNNNISSVGLSKKQNSYLFILPPTILP